MLAQVGVHIFQMYPLAIPQIHEEVCQLKHPQCPHCISLAGPGLINHQLAMLKFHHDAPHGIAQHPVQSTKLFFQNVWTGKPRYAGWWMVHDGEDSNAAFLSGVRGGYLLQASTDVKLNIEAVRPNPHILHLEGLREFL